MLAEEKSKLSKIVNRAVEINAKVQALKWELKELADSAWKACGVKAKTIKQLAKEAAWDDVQRDEQRLLEEKLDECRLALGMLKDLPLGQAAAEAAGRERLGGEDTGDQSTGADGTGGVTTSDGQAQATERRGRGRPKGSKNRPKPTIVGGTDHSQAPLDPPEPSTTAERAPVIGDPPIPDLSSVA